MLEIPNLRIADAKAEHVRAALALMEKHSKLNPRDATHVAFAFATGSRTIVSDDPDFEAIHELPRTPLD